MKRSNNSDPSLSQWCLFKWCCVIWYQYTDVSEKLVTSIFRVEKSAKQKDGEMTKQLATCICMYTYDTVMEAYAASA
jgi:hypothetical protein